MKIKKLKIRNFRSIKDLTIYPNSLCAIMGPNSSGKTNILKAIDLVIGEGWTTKARVAREFFYDPNKPIFISIEMEKLISFLNNGYTTKVSSIELKMTLVPELSAETTINGGEKFYGRDIFKKLCHFIYIPSERCLKDELRVSQWTMLGKLMKLVYDNYIVAYHDDEEQLKKDFEKEILPAKTFLEKDFLQDRVTFNKFSETFKKYCSQNSAGLASDFEPVLNIYNLNWFYKTLQINVKEDFPLKCFDSDEVGAGMQNLLMISIFQTYAELMGRKVVLGIEEPEIYLYPPAQRFLYDNFIKLSENTQIFYTTHNPNFVDASRPDDILLLRKNSDKGTYTLRKDPYFENENVPDEKYRIYTQFNPERNEVFFANKVLLVEGDSDKILFSTLCKERWSIDIDEKGIVIVSCGGKGGVNYFVGICKLIGLDNYFAVWDADDKNFQPDKNHLPDTASKGKGLEIPVNLENYLGLSESENSDKVKNAHKWASDSEKDIPATFDVVKDFLQYDPVMMTEEESVSEEPEIEEIPF